MGFSFYYVTFAILFKIINNQYNNMILEKRMYIDPQYDYLDRYCNIMYKSFWTPAKYLKLIQEQDAKQYVTEFGKVDQSVVKRCVLGIATVEDKVKMFWAVIGLDVPQTIVSDVGGLFTMSEVTHRKAYHELLNCLNIDTSEIENHDVLRNRINYLNKHNEKDDKVIGKKRILKKIVLFTSLVERVSLFTQFYILMSYGKRRNDLQTISALQKSTATEELVHYGFGIELINIIKSEYPALWDEYLIDLVSKNISDAYNVELNIINWIFEEGIPPHITKEEVINFLNFNFNTICKDLKLDLTFKFDEELYRTKNIWMMESIQAMPEPDFFNNSVGGYSSTDEIIDLTQIEF